MSGAREALAFLTPLGGARRPTPAALCWFPLVGAALGGVLGALWRLADLVWPPLIVAGLVVAADLALTGMLHLDGLVDTADGLLAQLDRDRRLAVMTAPGVGAFGLATGGVTLLLRFAALAASAPSPLLVVGLWCAARSLMAGAAGHVRYARTGGLAAAFLGGRPWAPAAAGAVGALMAGVAWRPLAGGVAVASGLIAGAAVVLLAQRRLGGFTGDVLGAAGMATETVGLVVAAARW